MSNQIVRRDIPDLTKGELVDIRLLGGTRRQSTALFVANNYDAMAMVPRTTVR